MKKHLLALLILLTALSLAFSGCSMNKKPAPKPAPGNLMPGTPTPSAPRQTPGNVNPGTVNPGTPAPKPTPSPNTTPPATPKPAPKPGAPADNSNKKLADAAKRVKGVKSATVIVQGTTATVGIETDSNIEGKKTDELKNKVTQEVKKADKTLKKVQVTTDPNIISRIKKVAQGIEKGRPISEFAKEVEEIGRRITPSGDKTK